MIPDEAVDAAAKVLLHGWLRYSDPADFAKSILEAAAPHLTKSPAEQAMADIEAHLERWFNGEQTQTAAMAAVSRISGRYKMESIK